MKHDALARVLVPRDEIFTLKQRIGGLYSDPQPQPMIGGKAILTGNQLK
jgi:hypothetical protein